MHRNERRSSRGWTWTFGRGPHVELEMRDWLGRTCTSSLGDVRRLVVAVVTQRVKGHARVGLQVVMLMLSCIGTPVPLHNLCHDPRLLLLLGFATDVFENIVHLFKRLAGRLGNAEEREDKREKTEDRKERVCTRPCVLDKGWCNEAL